jgi:hypothetical protein
MAATIFFSWQADTPNGIGRNFLRKHRRHTLRRSLADKEITLDEVERITI